MPTAYACKTQDLSPNVDLNLPELKKRGIIACSEKMLEVLALARKVAGSGCTVLILGESGVGKEVIARFIHEHSTYRQGPFIKINCSAIPETLLESELFGYAAGAFTGANQKGKAGKFEMADQGTIFLDEIGDLPLSIQVKLLHALEEKEFTRIGSNHVIKVNVRIITATNRDLYELVEKGRFRKDLFYRLNVVPVYIPPLRERRDDIMPLIMHFKKLCEIKYGTRRECSLEVVKSFCSHDWPGNVRELKNLIERIYIISKPDQLITPEVLMKDYLNVASYPGATEGGVLVTRLGTLKEIREEAERQLIRLALKNTRSFQKTAQLLEVDKATISRKVKRYQIEIPGLWQ